MSPSKVRVNEVERTLTGNDIVLFRSPKARHGTKIYEHRTVTRSKEKSPSSQLSEVGPWVVAQIYKASKLEFSDKDLNRRLGLSPRSPCAGVATGLLKTLKNRQKWHSIDTCLNTFKITTFHILNTKVTWVHTHSTTALDTGMQRQSIWSN